MRQIRPLLAMAAFLVTYSMNTLADSPIAFAIHGGAGTITRSDMTPDQEQAIRAKLDEALGTGYQVLEEGGDSLDAVVSAIRILEDSPYFNAGKGAVFTWDGKNELDASIMDGRTLNAGAVTGVQHIRNPISLARMVMEDSEHVFLSGAGAEEFALEQGTELVPASYFFTQRRWEQLEKYRQDPKVALADPPFRIGTVGAVALDRNGNLAAGTSTGGTTGKRYGRIGDSPVIGAGTYANNRSVAVSATGTGEYFIRAVAAHDIAAIVEYRGASLADAAHEVVVGKVGKLGGDGGVIAVDHRGEVSMPFNTEGMYRASIDASGRKVVAIYGSDDEGLSATTSQMPVQSGQ